MLRILAVSATVHVSAVETMIRDRYKDKKDAKEYAAGYLIEQLQGKLETYIKENWLFRTYYAKLLV